MLATRSQMLQEVHKCQTPPNLILILPRELTTPVHIGFQGCHITIHCMVWVVCWSWTYWLVSCQDDASAPSKDDAVLWSMIRVLIPTADVKSYLLLSSAHPLSDDWCRSSPPQRRKEAFERRDRAPAHVPRMKTLPGEGTGEASETIGHIQANTNASRRLRVLSVRHFP